MPKNYNSKNYEELRSLATYLGLGKDKELRIICEEIEELSNMNSIIESQQLLKRFEDYIYPKTKQFVAENIIQKDIYFLKFYNTAKNYGFDSIISLFHKDEPRSYSKSNFFHNLPREFEDTNNKNVSLRMKS